MVQCQEAGIIDGTHVAIDSAAIHAYEKKEPSEKANSPAMPTGERSLIAHGDHRQRHTPLFDGLSHDVLGAGEGTFEIPLSACDRSSGLPFRHGRLFILQLWNGRQNQQSNGSQVLCTTPSRKPRRKELYNKGTSVECCNSRMKTYLTADRLHVCGIHKVTTHQYLNVFVLLASALAIAKQRRPKRC